MYIRENRPLLTESVSVEMNAKRKEYNFKNLFFLIDLVIVKYAFRAN